MSPRCQPTEDFFNWMDMWDLMLDSRFVSDKGGYNDQRAPYEPKSCSQNQISMSYTVGQHEERM